jgi:hypothetical protein
MSAERKHLRVTRPGEKPAKQPRRPSLRDAQSGQPEVRLSDLLQWTKYLTSHGALPADADAVLDLAFDWTPGAPSNWNVTSRIHQGSSWSHSDPTVGRFRINKKNNKLERAQSPTASPVSDYVDGLATVMHGLAVMEAALARLRPLSMEAAQLLLEDEARAAGRCLYGHEVSGEGDDRLKRGLCPACYKRKQRAASGDK